MKSAWSKSWRESVQPRKQRKYVFNISQHLAGKFLRAPLSKDLRKKHSCRNVRVRTGDKVKVMRGQYKGAVGKVASVDVMRRTVFVTDVGVAKRDGSKALYPLAGSKLQVLELHLDAKRRREKLGGTPKVAKKKATTKKATTKKKEGKK